MTSHFFSQEDNALLFNSQLYPNLCTHATTAEDTSKENRRQRRKKKNRQSCGDVRKRNLTAEQVNCLEHSFRMDHTLETHRKVKIAAELNMDPQQIAVWFQNRRVRWRVKNLEEEYKKLKSAHEGIVLEKSHLQEEVLRLRAELSDAKRRMQMLAESSNGISCYDQDTSFSMDMMDPTFLGNFGIEGLGNAFQYFENVNSVHGMDWLNCV